MMTRRAGKYLPRMVLMDRDGVLNLDRADSVKSPDELTLVPGAAEAVAKLNRAGIKAVVVSNQSVVGRGIIDEVMLERIHQKLHDDLASAGAILDAVIVCTDHPDQATERRKPNPGMLREALARFGTEPAKSPMVGDALRDLEAAMALGCPRILVRTGKGAVTQATGIPPSLQPVAVYADLPRAVDALLSGKVLRALDPNRRSGLARFLRRAAAAAAIAWGVGFAWFVDAIPDHVADPTLHTDAIVVLTGGTERIHTGLELLAAGLGKRLLVSGVHPDVSVAELLRMFPDVQPALACCIDLGYEASDTIGNAEEASAWMRAQGFHSLRLVTANYHLPRSLLEFHSAMPDAEIVPHPVFPPSAQEWWRRPAGSWLIAAEYTKYLAARLRHEIQSPMTAR